MGVEFPTYRGKGDSRPALHAFIIAVRTFLNDLVVSNRDPKRRRVFFKELLANLRAAWREAYPEFERIAHAIDGISDTAIRDHGLSGYQLRFKLSVVRFLHRRYLQRAGTGPLRHLLSAINTLRKSILSAVGVGEGIKEIKDYIEHALQERS